MEKKTPRPMTPFDELTTPYSFSILKLLLPYLDPGGGSFLWIMVKFMELQYTISILRHPGPVLRGQAFGNFPDSPAKLLDEIAPYLPPEQAQMAETFQNVMNMMEMMQMFQSTDAPSGDPSDTGTMDSMFSGINPMDMMMNMMSPEQQDMFQMYQDMFSNNENQENSKTGDDDHERMDEQPASEGHRSGEAGTDPDGRLTDEREIR